MKNLLKEQRLIIYQKAYEYFKTNPKGGVWSYYGMCYALDMGMMESKIFGKLITPNLPPEFLKFKPKSKWKKNPMFWWSTDSKKAYERRLEILKYLASGEWM